MLKKLYTNILILKEKYSDAHLPKKRGNFQNIHLPRARAKLTRELYNSRNAHNESIDNKTP